MVKVNFSRKKKKNNNSMIGVPLAKLTIEKKF